MATLQEQQTVFWEIFCYIFQRKIKRKYLKLLSATFSDAALTLCMLGKKFSRQHFEIFFLFFLEKKIWHVLQIVS